MVKIGCCGFPVSQAAYFREFGTVEINASFYRLPREATAARWRAAAPPDFEFALKAWQLVTHTIASPTYGKAPPALGPRARERIGHFKQSEEVERAWMRFEAVARELRPRFILFQTPPSFYPDANHLRDMYRFFKRARRGDSLFVWESRGGGWEERLLAKVCADLDLIPAGDPLAGTPQGVLARGAAAGRVRYLRMHGGLEEGRIRYGHAYSDSELATLDRLCSEGLCYAYFNNVEMWRDARRLRDLRLPAWRPPRRGLLSPRY